MTDEETNENEQAQLRKIIAFQKVAFGIVLKWKWLFLLLVVMLSATFLSYFHFKSVNSVSRYESSTTQGRSRRSRRSPNSSSCRSSTVRR